VSQSAAVAPGNTVAFPSPTPGKIVAPEHIALACLREALRRCYDKQGVAAAALGLDQGHLSAQLNGTEAFDMRRLARTPVAAAEFAALFAKAMGHTLASPTTIADRRRRQAIALHCIALTRAVLDEDEPLTPPTL
jgi:hypothetical protein